MAPPIRVAIIGLSASAKTAWASSAHLPYLLSPRGRGKYQVVALLNSSADAARAAVAAFNLDPDTTRTYGNPAELAADKEVDLVVCVTRVDKHYETVIDSVRAGKDAFVEWPLAQNGQRARELADAAAVSGARTVVGLQGTKAPVVAKLREVLESGRIGKVLSSELRVFGGLHDRVSAPEGLAYFAQREVGGNIYTIGFAHVFDMVLAVLGDLASAKGDFHLQRPEFKLVDATGKDVGTVPSSVPDLIHLSGKWNESKITQRNATLHYRFRRGQSFPGEPVLSWSIAGEKGEIRVVSPDFTFLQVGHESIPSFFEVHDHHTDNVEKVEWQWEDWTKELPYAARNIGALYEAFADVKASGAKESYPTFDYAAGRHELLDGLLSEWKA